MREGEGPVFGQTASSPTPYRCSSLTRAGTRCTREPMYGIHDFYWCWQHYRMLRGECPVTGPDPYSTREETTC